MNIGLRVKPSAECYTLAMQLAAAFQQTAQIIQDEVDQLFTRVHSDVEKDDPWSVVVVEALREYALRPGKAVRPLLVAVGSSASADVSLETALQDPKVHRLMLIIHLIHKRLLMADDVADQDEVRNDEPAFHIWFEGYLNTLPLYQSLTPERRQHYARTYTEVSGIFLQQILSFLLQYDALFDQKTEHRLAAIINRHSYERTVAGWLTLLDQNIEPLTEQVSIARFMKGLEMVTSDYTFISPLLCGAALGNQFESLQETIKELGTSAGILFQITDDNIGLYGEPEVTGKPVGGDVREGKKTLLVQFAYRRLQDRPAEQEKLVSLVGKPDLTQEEVDWVRSTVKETGAFNEVKEVITAYVKKAENTLDSWTHEETKDFLIQLSQLISTREK